MPTTTNGNDVVANGGGNGNGLVDNTNAFVSQLQAVCNAGGGTVTVPGGLFRVNGQVTVNIPANKSIRLIGAGQDATEVWFYNGSGFNFVYGNQFSSVHMEDLTITTNQVATGVAVNLVSNVDTPDPANTAQNNFTNVTIRGRDSYNGGFNWAYGYVVTNVSNVNWFGGMIKGPSSAGGCGILVRGVNADRYSVALNVSGTTFNYLTQGFVYGEWVQGVTVSQANFTNCVYGIHCPPNTVGDLYGLNVTVSQFGCRVRGVFLQTGVGSFSFVGNIVGVSEQNGIGVEMGAGSFTITGNQINGYGDPFSFATNGVLVSSGGNGAIVGNSFNGLTTAVGVSTPSPETVVVTANYRGNCPNYIAGPTAAQVRRSDNY